MYYDFFGFREPPFSIAPDPRYLYLTERHKEALAHLMYGVQGQGGFIVITGEVGTGKTTVSRCFIENAPDNVDIALILNPRLTARELLSAICDELEIPHEVGASIKQLVDLINQDLLKAHAAGRHKVLMIDEAQNLSADVLEQLRLLTNLETAEKKLLQIVLLGQPELQEILALPELRQLNQRVTARYHLDAIGRDELPAYLKYRLGVAGMRGDLFTAGAVARLYRESQGIPRLINLISDRALLGAYAEGEHEITAAHIRQAAREVRGQGVRPRTPSRTVRPRYLWGLVAVLLVAVAAVASVEPWLPGLSARFGSSLPWAGTVERADSSGDSADAGVEPPSVAPRESESLAPFRFAEQTLPEQDAYAVLFRVWGRTLPEDRGTEPCAYARDVGLGCLVREGSRRSLEFLDRPARLTLRGERGETGYVVLRRLDGDRAELWLPGGRSVWVSFERLAGAWFGEFLVLWRLPEYLSGDGFYAIESGEQLWLGARMMELADRLLREPAESARVKRLPMAEQVRWYQAFRGLSVDGIAGAMTVIQIHNDLNAPVPRLRSVVSPIGGS